MGGVYTSSYSSFSLQQMSGGLYAFSAPPNTTTSLPASQQQFPTSAYGQTVPVIWGKARVPGGYIWAPDIIVRTTTTGLVLQTTTVRVLLSARIRFAAPLVRDSTWKIRRLWQDGTLIVDNSRGYKKSGFNYRFYDGRSTQGRDSHMASKEGAANVSAHRGYIDIVIQNYDLGVAATQPPSFEAELVQDDTGSIDVDNVSGFFSNEVITEAAADWESGFWYGVSGTYLRRFDIGTKQEISALPMSGLQASPSIDERGLRYLPTIDRIVLFQHSGINLYPTLVNPENGSVVGSDDVGNYVLHATAVLSFGSDCILLSSTLAGVSTSQLFTHRINAGAIELAYESDIGWGGRGVVQCIAVGEVRADTADVYVIAGAILYKLVITASGGIPTITEVYTDADDLAYCFYYDGNVIVWDDNLTILRIEPSDGSTVWTKTVPYQIATNAAIREFAPPDMHRVEDTLMYEVAASYYFTDLDDGSTETVAKASSTVGRQVYDGVGGVGLNTDLGSVIARQVTFDAVGDGTLRDLEDFIADVWEATGYDASEHVEQNIDDQIQGAVIDITGGGREVIRSVAEPYSFSIFERGAAIYAKRALTDGSFVVDATITSTDIADQGGQAIRARRLNPEEFIARYGINYRDPDEVYQARPQWGEIPSLPIPVAPTDIGISADIPIIADADTIKVLATEKVNRLAIERHEFEFRLKAKFADLEPEDIIQFTFANRLVTARIYETTLNPDLTISVKCTEFLSSVSVSISGGTGRPVEPEPVGTEQSRYYHLDIPLLSDTDDAGGGSFVQYHVLASAGQPYWDGATLYRKDSIGAYVPLASQVENGLVGVALSALPDWDIPYVTEFTREITVAVISGDTDLLVSKTYQEVCEGANMFAIGQPGRWEVCHVIDITDNGDNTYTFTGLRRGRGSSEEFTGLHEAGDFVVWLGDDNVQRLEYAIDTLDDSFDFKPVGFGGSLSSTIAVNRTITGEAEKIPKPAFVSIERVSTNIVIDWVRRSRIGSYWSDGGEDEYTAPLGESLEQYVLRIKSGPGGSVLRTVTVDDLTTYSYSDANQTTDFGSTIDAGESLTVDIRQVSGTGVVCPTREITTTF